MSWKDRRRKEMLADILVKHSDTRAPKGALKVYLTQELLDDLHTVSKGDVPFDERDYINLLNDDTG